MILSGTDRSSLIHAVTKIPTNKADLTVLLVREDDFLHLLMNKADYLLLSIFSPYLQFTNDEDGVAIQLEKMENFMK